MIVILGVDPGLSTGVAEITGGRRGVVFQGDQNVAMDVLDERLRLHTTADTRVSVACERFVQMNRGAMTQQPEAQQVIGQVRRLVHTYNVRLDLQMPADAKRIASDTLLRRASLWVQPKDVGQADADDVRMAMKHAVLLMSRRHATLFDALLSYASGVR